MIRHIGSLSISKTIKEKLIKNGIETLNELNDTTIIELNRCKFFFCKKLEFSLSCFFFYFKKALCMHFF
jgi:hypothetical protein